MSVEKRKPYIKRICERVIYRMNNEHFDTVSYDAITEDNYSDITEFDFLNIPRAIEHRDRSDCASIPL